MRNLLLLFTLVLGLVACGGGDDCTSETVPGTYTGSNTCDDAPASVDLPEGDVTFTITHLGGNNYAATDQDGEEVAFTMNGCDITIPDLEFEFFGIMLSTSGDGKIDGDQLTLNITTGVDGLEFTCNYIGTKQ